MAKAASRASTRNRNHTDSNAKSVSVGVLNGALVDMMDLTNATRQAHWNVKGPQFYGLHTMFEMFYTTLNTDTDEVAERLVQLGGITDGTTQAVGEKTRLEPYPRDLLQGLDHCDALSSRYSAIADNLRDGIEKTDEAGDPDTSDLLTAVSQNIEKFLWMLDAHLDGREGAAA